MNVEFDWGRRFRVSVGGVFLEVVIFLFYCGRIKGFGILFG